MSKPTENSAAAAKRVALVTGAGRGIGRATAIELSRRGFTVVAVSRSLAELDETVRLCGGGMALAGDVADAGRVREIAGAVAARFGSLAAVVNNAGFASAQPIERTTDTLWRQTLDVNLSAMFFVCRECWPLLRASRGAIVNVSSESTRDPFPGFAAYAAAKAGVNGLSLALAREGAAEGIRVHTVSPGASETAMFRSIVSEAQWSKDRTLEPAHVARVIADCIDGPLVHTAGEIIYLRR